MGMPEPPLVIYDHNTEDEKAYLSELADKWRLTVTHAPPEGLALHFNEGVLELNDFSEAKQQGVCVDFLSSKSRYRKEHGGGKKEPIAKAVGLKGVQGLTVLDATPGLGRDAFVLVCLGCRVVLMERSGVVTALLDDGIRRLQREESELASRFTLIQGDSIQRMGELALGVDVVYIDPMFPHRKKSALVKKEMRVFQRLLGADEDAGGLLKPAQLVAEKRVVVKRPATAAPLADVPPTMAITSKKHRFDVYISHIQ